MHSDHKLTMLRTNTGGEFNSTKFHDYCKTQWIKKELIIRYTVQHNGVLKRKNRSMWRWQEAYWKVKAFQIKFGLKQYLRLFNYILNKLPIKTRSSYNNLLQQYVSHCQDKKKSNVSCQNQAHWDLTSFHQGAHWKQREKVGDHSNHWPTSRYFYQRHTSRKMYSLRKITRNYKLRGVLKSN